MHGERELIAYADFGLSQQIASQICDKSCYMNDIKPTANCKIAQHFVGKMEDGTYTGNKLGATRAKKSP